MKTAWRAFWVICLMAGIMIPPSTFAVSQQTVIINEVLPGTVNSAGEEFIELYNYGDFDISLSGWKLQYVSATTASWSKPTRSISLSGNILSHKYYLIASTGYLSGQSIVSYSSTMAQTGGHLRILDGQSNVIDLVGWGGAVMPVLSPAPAPTAGQSIGRKLEPNILASTNNGIDFSVTSQPTPAQENNFQIPDLPAEENLPVSPDVLASNFSQILISEILPNPASPLTDANDEFVELYNPGATAVNLSAYMLTAGLTESHKFVIGDINIEPQGYLTIFSKDSKLNLSNSGGKVKLYSPNGIVMDETDIYGQSPDGYSWIPIDGIWQWTTLATPGVSNTFSVPIIKSTKSVPYSSLSAISEQTAPAKSSNTKSTSKSSPKTSTSKSAQSTTDSKVLGTNSSSGSSSVSQQKRSIHPIVLAVLGGMALIYGCYEYRYDLANFYRKFGRYNWTGKINWSKFGWQRMHRVSLRPWWRKDHSS